MPPRGLSDLPEELLLYIVESTCEDEPFTKIHNLLFVNRQISRLALPFLYRNLCDTGFDDYDSEGFRKLILTLLFDPAKAELVHSFSVETAGEFDDGARLKWANDQSEEYAFTAEQHAELERTVNVLKEYESSDEAEKRWENHFLDEPLMGAILALMLARLPNLHELTIHDVHDEYWKVFEYVVDGMAAASKHKKTGVPVPFAKLDKVKIGGSAPEYPHSTFPLTVVAKWPSVKVVEGTQIGDGDNNFQEEPDKWFLDLKPGSTHYTSLTFRPSSKLLGEHLVLFLGTAQALDTFNYHIGHAWAWIPLFVPELSQALDQHKETLKSITLQLSDMEKDNEDSDFTSMSFKEYPSLTHLHIAFDLLFGLSGSDTQLDATAAQQHIVDAIPQSLETLQITQCDNAVVEAATSAVRSVLRMKEERWPRLAEIMVAAEPAGWESLKEKQAGLEAEADRHGVMYTATMCRTSFTTGLEFGSPEKSADEDEEDETSRNSKEGTGSETDDPEEEEHGT